MLLPPGQILHRDLGTKFTNFVALLAELKESRFSGYVRLNFWEYEGILVLDGGKITQAQSSEKNASTVGTEAALRIFDLARHPDGSIDVHRLPSEVAVVLAAVLGAEFFKDEKQFYDPRIGPILQDLQERGLTGYMDIHFGLKKGMGTIYLLEGIPVESVVMSSTGRMISGEAVYNKILEIGDLINPEIRVYRSLDIQYIHEQTDLIFPGEDSVVLEFWNNIIMIFKSEFDRIMRTKKFEIYWLESLLQAATRYSFLNPGKSELTLMDGRLNARAVLAVNQVNEALTFILRLIMEKVPARKKRKMNLNKSIERVQRLPQFTSIIELFNPQQVVKKILSDS